MDRTGATTIRHPTGDGRTRATERHLRRPPRLPAVQARTLVLHRSGDLLFSVEAGRYYAEHIPGARFVLLEGTDHIPYFEEPDRIVDLIEEFVTGSVSRPRRPLATSRRAGGPFDLTGREQD